MKSLKLVAMLTAVLTASSMNATSEGRGQTNTAQQPQQQSTDESQSFRFRTGVELINVTATVTDESGRFVSGLRKEDFRVYQDEFDKAYQEGGMLMATFHPHIVGRRSRMVHLEKFIAYLKSKPGVWFATAEAIANHVKPQNGKSSQ